MQPLKDENNVIGFIAFVVFGEIKYRKGDYGAKKPQKKALQRPINE